MEYKYELDKGQALLYSWTSTAPVHYELHSEPTAGPKGYAEFFDQQDDREQAHGSYVAPFAGIHGWFWENRSDREITLRLSTRSLTTGPAFCDRPVWSRPTRGTLPALPRCRGSGLR